MLKTSHLQLWPARDKLPQFEYIIQSYDTAFTEEPDADYTANMTFGVFYHNERKKNCIMILDSWNEHLTYPNLRRKVITDWGATYGGDDELRIRGKKADDLLVEEKSSGISLLQDLALANIPAKAYNPGKRSKETRAHLAAPILEMDLIYAMESNKRPGEPVSWVQPFIDQAKTFPMGAKKDLVDSFSQGILYIKEGRWLDLDPYEEEEDEESQYADSERKVVNPYAS